LEKYWKAVKDDPADFTGWTYLLQYVDQEVSAELYPFGSVLWPGEKPGNCGEYYKKKESPGIFIQLYYF